MARKNRQDGEQVIIKKYANRRLYNTDKSCYVTLDDLAEMVKDDTDFVVRDAKSGADITHSVLTQIIFEEEGKGEKLLPTNFLRQLIAFYGDGLQQVVPGYLESSMAAFTENQEKFRGYFKDNLDQSGFPMKPLKLFEEMAKQNMEIFEKTMSMFSPFGGGAREDQAEDAQSQNVDGNSSEDKDQLKDLQAQLAAMQDQLNSLKK